MALLAAAGKTPVHVKKDVAGLRRQPPAARALARGDRARAEKASATRETVDTVVKASFGRRLAVLGPLENADLVGTDLTLDIHRRAPASRSHAGTHPLSRTAHRRRKARHEKRRRFPDLDPEEAQDLRKRVFTHLRKLNAAERGEGGANDDQGNSK